MASIDRTAYPRLRSLLTDKELAADFTLSEDEAAFVRRSARGDVGRLSLAVILKTRQRLGYFVALSDVPQQIRLHVAGLLGLAEQTALVDSSSRPATIHRYREAIRERLGSRPFSHGGRAVVIVTVHRAAQTMSDPADLISASIEALVKERIELPAFATLDRLIGTLRQEIHEALYASVDSALSDTQRRVLDALLDHPLGDHLNAFSRLKATPGPPTLKHLRQWIDRLAELDAILDPRPLLAGVPHTKIRLRAGGRMTSITCFKDGITRESRTMIAHRLIEILDRELTLDDIDTLSVRDARRLAGLLYHWYLCAESRACDPPIDNTLQDAYGESAGLDGDTYDGSAERADAIDGEDD